MSEAQGELHSVGVVTRQEGRLSGPVQRWIHRENQWEDGWLRRGEDQLDGALGERASRAAEERTRGGVDPVAHLHVEDEEVDGARRAADLREDVPKQPRGGARSQQAVEAEDLNRAAVAREEERRIRRSPGDLVTSW